MDNVCLLVQSCDKDELLWPVWHYYWRKFWGCQDLMPAYLMTQAKQSALEGITTIQSGKSDWGQEMHVVLDSIPEEYVIMLHEDYFLTEPTDRKTLETLINGAMSHQTNLLKICGSWAGFVDDRKPLIPTDLKAGPYTLWQYPNTRMYLISHQISIWKKSFLRDTILPGYTPWDHELSGTDRIRSWLAPIYAYVGEPPIPYTEVMQRNHTRSEDARKMILRAVNDMGFPPSKLNTYGEAFRCK